MTRRRIAVFVAIVAIAAVGGLLGGVLSDAPSGRVPAPPPADVAASQVLQGFSLADTESLVRDLQDAVRDNPTDVQSLTLLGLAYQQRARESGDPTYYTKAEGVLERALELAPSDLLATSGLGSLALARHEFREALELGKKAVELSPTTARNYGIVGDALAELGRYDEAFAAFDTMARLRPGLAAYARVSYARELLGQTQSAIEAMELALDAATGAPEPLAWTNVQLGKIYWSTGDLDNAESHFRQALSVLPGYVYGLDALAQVEAARGRLDRAIELERQAVEQIPLPQFVAALGDLYHVTANQQLAQEQYELMDVIQRLLRENGVETDLETALYYADHDIRLPEALELARAAQAARPSIDGDDVLAWALYKNGRCQEALEHSERALRLGTKDALKFFHRGMIERCLGHGDEASSWFRRSLALNPNFSLLWAPVAEEDEA